VEAGLGAAVRVGVGPAEARQPRDLVLIHAPVDPEDARARAALVQGTAAQRIELCARPDALEEVTDTVGDERHPTDLDTGRSFLRPRLAARIRNGLRQDVE